MVVSSQSSAGIQWSIVAIPRSVESPPPPLFIKSHGWVILRRCETPPSPPTPDPVGIENRKQLFSSLLAFTTQKIATHSMDIISDVCVGFFGS